MEIAPLNADQLDIGYRWVKAGLYNLPDLRPLVDELYYDHLQLKIENNDLKEQLEMANRWKKLYRDYL